MDFDRELETIGMPGSIGKDLIETIRNFISRGFLAGFCVYLALIFDWPASIVDFLEPIGFMMSRIILGLVGVGLIPGAVGVINDGFGGITESRRQSRRRNEIKAELEPRIQQRRKLREAQYSSLIQRTTKELAAEQIIQSIKETVAGSKERLQGVPRAESIVSITLGMTARILLLLILSVASYRISDGDAIAQFVYNLPFDPFPPGYLRIAMKALAVIFLFSTLGVLETTVGRFDTRRYLAGERNRLDAQLQLELIELDRYQATVIEQIDAGNG
jgi:hypothetical protein